MTVLNSRCIARLLTFHIQRETTMATTTMVHVRVDEQIKAQATETFASMGLCPCLTLCVCS